MVPVVAKVDDVAPCPCHTLIDRRIDAALVPVGVAEKDGNGCDDGAAAGLDDIHEPAAVAIQDPVVVGPGLALVEAASRPYIGPDIGRSLAALLVPVPEKTLAPRIDRDADALPRPDQHTARRRPRLGSLVDWPRSRPGLTIIVADGYPFDWGTESLAVAHHGH